MWYSLFRPLQFVNTKWTSSSSSERNSGNLVLRHTHTGMKRVTFRRLKRRISRYMAFRAIDHEQTGRLQFFLDGTVIGTFLHFSAAVRDVCNLKRYVRVLKKNHPGLKQNVQKSQTYVACQSKVVYCSRCSDTIQRSAPNQIVENLQVVMISRPVGCWRL